MNGSFYFLLFWIVVFFRTQGMGEYLKAEQADIVVITETFTGDPNLPVINNRYPVSFNLILKLKVSSESFS